MPSVQSIDTKDLGRDFKWPFRRDPSSRCSDSVNPYGEAFSPESPTKVPEHIICKAPSREMLRAKLYTTPSPKWLPESSPESLFLLAETEESPPPRESPKKSPSPRESPKKSPSPRESPKESPWSRESPSISIQFPYGFRLAQIYPEWTGETQEDEFSTQQSQISPHAHGTVSSGKTESRNRVPNASETRKNQTPKQPWKLQLETQEYGASTQQSHMSPHSHEAASSGTTGSRNRERNASETMENQTPKQPWKLQTETQEYGASTQQSHMSPHAHGAASSCKTESSFAKGMLEKPTQEQKAQEKRERDRKRKKQANATRSQGDKTKERNRKRAKREEKKQREEQERRDREHQHRGNFTTPGMVQMQNSAYFMQERPHLQERRDQAEELRDRFQAEVELQNSTDSMMTVVMADMRGMINTFLGTVTQTRNGILTSHGQQWPPGHGQHQCHYSGAPVPHFAGSDLNFAKPSMTPRALFRTEEP